jgi:hypothetical protein
MSRYQINLLSPSGTYIKDLSAFQMLQWSRAENKIGVAELWLPAQLVDPSFLQLDQILEIERNGGILNETSYFLRYADFYETNEGAKMVHLIGYDANYLLDSRIIAYASGSSEGNKSDKADDMMKEIVDENLVNPTDSDRDVPNLTIAGDLGDGPTVDMAIARDNVLEACQDISELSTDRGTYMAFDTVRVSRNSYQFRTYTGQRGQDHSQGGSAGLRLVGPQYGNLQEARIILFDRKEERNLAYSGGQGEGAARDVSELEDTTRTNASPYNRREVWVDARNTETTAAREDRGYQALEKYKPVQTLTGKLVDTKGLRFMVDYGFGDLVTATAFGYTVDCHIDKMSAVVIGPQSTSGQPSESLTTYLRGEL